MKRKFSDMSSNTLSSPKVVKSKSKSNKNRRKSLINDKSIPTPSKVTQLSHESLFNSTFSTISCEGFRLENVKANVDELKYIISGLMKDNQSSELMADTLIRLGIYALNDKNQIVIRAFNITPLIITKARFFFKNNLTHKKLQFGISALCFVFCSQLSLVDHLDDSIVAILIQLLSFDNISLAQFIAELAKSESTSVSPQSTQNRKVRVSKRRKMPQSSGGVDSLVALCTQMCTSQYDMDTFPKIDSLTPALLAGLSLHKLLEYISDNTENGKNSSGANDVDGTKENSDNSNSDEMNETVLSTEGRQTLVLQYLCHPIVLYKNAKFLSNECHKFENRGCDDISILSFAFRYQIYSLFATIESTVRLGGDSITAAAVTAANAPKPEESDAKESISDETDMIELSKQSLLLILDSGGNIIRGCVSILASVSCDDSANRGIDIDMDTSLQNSLQLLAKNSDNPQQSQMEKTMIWLRLILTTALKTLTNVTNRCNVSMKLDTMKAIFYLLSHASQLWSDKSYELQCLSLGVIINCAEKNKSFRNGFHTNVMESKRNWLEYSIDRYMAIRSDIQRFTNERRFDKVSECKSLEFYFALLLGFLMQSMIAFQMIANHLSVNYQTNVGILGKTLKEFIQNQRNNTESNQVTNQTKKIVMSVMAVIKLRFDRQQQSQQSK